MLKNIKINFFRNIFSASLEFSEKFNFIYGENGAGKTSLLEAIYILGNGKSFRTAQNQDLILSPHDQINLFGHFENQDKNFIVGLEKKTNSSILKINASKQRTMIEILKNNPIIIVNPDTYALIEDSPEIRRTFLNWGMFHVEPQFNILWKNFNKCLKQRNVAIKSGQSKLIWQTWDQELSKYGESLNEMRLNYINLLMPYFLDLIKEISFPYPVEISLKKGWEENISFLESLKKNESYDFQQGFTNFGPQKADLLIKTKGNFAANFLSRGQEKLLVSLLRFSQGKMLNEKKNLDIIYLLDDLPSELDFKTRKALLNICKKLRGQFFMTSIEPDIFKESFDSFKMFHVEQGSIQEQISSLKI